MIIKLSNAESITLIDEEDWELVKSYKWLLNNGYALAYRDHKQIYLHRLILGDKPKHEIDHINRDKLDNRRNNLRHVTRSENKVNGFRVDSKPGHLRHIRKYSAGWQVLFTRNSKTVYLGKFATYEEARAVRDTWLLANEPMFRINPELYT